MRWHWIALGLVVGLAIGFYLIWRAVPQYSSTATVRVKDHNISALGHFDPAGIDPRNLHSIETRAGWVLKPLSFANWWPVIEGA